MIAIFQNLEEAQSYCDERADARGLPNENATAWDVPRVHPTNGTASAVVDSLGPVPDCLETVESLPSDWNDAPQIPEF